MTEQQPYDVVRTTDSFELRRYPEHVVAEVAVDGSFEDAGNRAFRDLFGYISGDNESAQKVAMTAPVVQSDRAEEDSSAKIAMTAPVIQRAVEDDGAVGEGGYVVAFVLPASLTEESAPRPTNARVHLRTVPERLVAALRYRGRWTKEGYDRHLGELRSALEAEAIPPVGHARFARFDPPFLPAFLRHNEVLLDVDPAVGLPAS